MQFSLFKKSLPSIQTLIIVLCHFFLISRYHFPKSSNVGVSSIVHGFFFLFFFGESSHGQLVRIKLSFLGFEMNLNTVCGRGKRLNFYFSFEQCEKDFMHLVNSFMICCLLLVDYLSQTGSSGVYTMYSTISRPSDTRVTLKANKNISKFELICFSPLDRSNGD